MPSDAALAMIFCGPTHPLVLELQIAERDRRAACRALQLFDELAPLPRRRLLATYAALSEPRQS